MDPEKHPGAVRYDRLSYDEVIERKLGVMDATAIVLCRDHHMPIRVMDMGREGALLRGGVRPAGRHPHRRGPGDGDPPCLTKWRRMRSSA